VTLGHEFLFQLHDVILLYFIPLYNKISFVNFDGLVLSRTHFIFDEKPNQTEP